MNDSSEDIIRFAGTGIAFNGNVVFENISFAIQKGEFVYLIGRTGQGKSSLLKMIYADLKPGAGEVYVDKYAIHKLPKSQTPFLRRRLGIVFQDFQLLPEYTVAENLEFVMKATGWRDKAKMRTRTTDLLMLVGLSARAGHYPHQLSGGEQQRTAIARALVNDPVVLVADEPTGNLDPEVTEHIMQILQKVNRAGTAVLMATHELDLIRRHPARTLRLQDGSLTEVPAGQL